MTGLHLSLPILSPIDGNCTEGIQWVWVVFRQCATTPNEIVAVTFGLISAAIWLIFPLPQIVENFRKGIPDQAISPYMLACFLIGDTINLMGCTFVHQLPLQTISAAIGVVSDLIQISQFIYYYFKHKAALRRFASQIEVTLPRDSESAVISPIRTSSSPILAVFFVFGFVYLFEPTWPKNHHNYNSLSPLSRRLLLTESSIPLLRSESMFPTGSLIAGYVMGWIATSIYITSRLSQILKNWQRGSTEGLTPVTFICAIIGNTAYGLQLLLTSVERTFMVRALPWLCGSVGVAFLDAIICTQFYRYRRREYLALEEGTVS